MDLALPAFFAALFTTVGGLVVWFFQSRAETIRKLEESLQDRRLKLYTQSLDPFIRLFSNIGDSQASARVIKEVKSYEYRKTIFELTMFGSDEVVQAHNALWTHMYEAEHEGQQPREVLRLWAALLLAVRRSVGNSDTNLDEWDMLASQIKDIGALRSHARMEPD